jgi:hypothetical protein
MQVKAGSRGVAHNGRTLPAGRSLRRCRFLFAHFKGHRRFLVATAAITKAARP